MCSSDLCVRCKKDKQVLICLKLKLKVAEHEVEATSLLYSNNHQAGNHIWSLQYIFSWWTNTALCLITGYRKVVLPPVLILGWTSEFLSMRFKHRFWISYYIPSLTDIAACIHMLCDIWGAMDNDLIVLCECKPVLCYSAVKSTQWGTQSCECAHIETCPPLSVHICIFTSIWTT